MSELKAIRSGEIYDIIEYEDCYRTYDLYYPKSEADKVIAKKDAEILRMIENWNRLCEKYNKLIKLKQEFCDKFKDIELEITK